MALQIGDVIQNKYKIVRMIGHGGMGAVYEGENMAIARRVAIKVLLKMAAGQQGVVERFEREAQAAGRIGNDHILEVLDMGTLDDGDYFMVMEYLDGENLQERIDRNGKLAPQEIAPLARQLLTGLQAAHDAGIIHRDLKPENVFILKEKAGRPDYVKIIDFGISKFTQLGGDMKMTATGAVMGTPYYMSPEQAKGVSAADSRSDLYAVGVIIYRAITGQVPFDGQTFNELLFKIVLSPLPNAREFVPDLDPAFESIIHKAMAREAEDRFQTANEFIDALAQWEQSGAAVSVAPEGTEEQRRQSVVMGQTRHDGPVPQHTPTGTVMEHQLSPAAVALSQSGGQHPSQTGAWSNTGEQAIPKRSNAGVVAAAVVGGLLLLGGGGFAAYSAMSGDDAVASEPAATSSEVTPEPSSAAEPEQAPDEPEVAPAIEETGGAAAEGEGGAASDETDGGAGGDAVTSATAASASASAAPVAAKPKPRPIRRPRPVSKPPPPKPSPKTNTPDFGY